MTNEERQNLCDRLRHLPSYLSEDGMRAADEIERLAALAQSDAEPPPPLRYSNTVEKAADGTETRHLELAQSNAEPVAWPDIDAAVKAGLAWRNPAPNAAVGLTPSKMVTISVPTAPPRPDASAGLIEAGQGSLVSNPSSGTEIAKEWRSTPAMRARIREMAKSNSDDYDRAVIAVLDDFENMLGKPL